MNQDYVNQESTEAGTKEIIARSGHLQSLLQKYGLTTEDVCDYHRYPIADNDSPQLSADRLEYTLHNLIRYVGQSPDVVRRYYEDLFVGKNERGTEELAFRTPAIAADFTLDALAAAKIYVLDEDRFSMQALANLLKSALEQKVLTTDDLYSTEPQVIAKLKASPDTAKAWQSYRSLHLIKKSTDKPDEPGWISIPAKKRWIDPLALCKCGSDNANNGANTDNGAVQRTCSLFPKVKASIDAFCALDFAYWIKGF